MKISLITVCYNSQNTIERCVKSVIAQDYPDIEYILVDGGSGDDTLQIIGQYRQYFNLVISEKDNGIYDAMNKGIQLATGDIIGTLNSDDVFAGADVLSAIAGVFNRQNPDIVYGNLNFIDKRGRIARKWHAGRYKSGIFNWGWMPPHPSFYCKKRLFERLGFYDPLYGTAADYELMLRFMHLNRLNSHYINKTIVLMNLGGASNKSFYNRLQASFFDFKAMKNNGVILPPIAILFKPLRKLRQYRWIHHKIGLLF